MVADVANWAGNVAWAPLRVAAPGSVEALRRVLADAAAEGLTVRPAGSRHSFTALCQTGGIALDLGGFTGVQSIDGDLVTVGAGTPLHLLNVILDRFGLAMANLGDIDRQTLAGALSTGTHGTGAQLPGLAAQVERFTLVTVGGDVLTCSRTQNPQLFHAACVGLGAFGVVVDVTLRCVPAFGLAARVAHDDLAGVLSTLPGLVSADHFEFFWFPHSDDAQVKTARRMAPGEPVHPLPPLRRWLEQDVVENAGLAALCQTARLLPRQVPRLHRLAGALISEQEYSDRSDRVFISRRSVRFVESEFAIPPEALPGVLDAVAELVRGLEVGPIFPVEVRYAAADDLWLSTAFERAGCYVAMHQFHAMPYGDLMAGFARICAEAGGRPHWGKLHPFGAAQLAARYPRFADAAALRRELDPAGVLLNAHLRHVFGED